MTRVLLVLSSVREGRTADKILSHVQNEIKNFPNIKVEIADFKKTPLPLIDSPHSPASEEFSPLNQNVLAWTKQVEEADVVLPLVAEYNHSYTPVLKNAIDWIYKPWINKPVAFISYGWAGGTRATKHLRDVFASNISSKVMDTEANLYFTKDIDLDGTALNDNVGKSINVVLESIQDI